MSFPAAAAATFGPSLLWLLPALIALAALLAALVPAARRRLSTAALTAAAAGAGLLFAAFLIARGADPHDTLLRVLRAACSFAAALSAISVSGVLAFDALLPKIRLRPAALVRDLILAAAYVAALFAVLADVGVNLSGLVATSAVVTAILAFALQDTLGHVLGGMVLQFERTIQPGDWVRIGSDEGVVKEIRWRQTQILTSGGDAIVVPNSALMKSVVTALGRRDGVQRRRRYTVAFSVPYAWNPGLVIETVEKALRDDLPPKVLAEPAPQCLVTELLEGRATYMARFWLSDPSADDAARSAVRVRAYYGLARAGIAMGVEPSQAVAFEDGKAVRERRAAEESARRLAALRGVDLFRSLTPEELATLADRLKPAPFARGEALTRQGATGHWLYILAKGEAEVQLRAADASEKIARLKAGDFMGEMALMTGEPRTATVVALEDVECYRLDRDGFREVLARRPEIAEHVALTLARRRGSLESARGAIDSRRQESVGAAQSDLLSRIRDFFAL